MQFYTPAPGQMPPVRVKGKSTDVQLTPVVVGLKPPSWEESLDREVVTVSFTTIAIAPAVGHKLHKFPCVQRK